MSKYDVVVIGSGPGGYVAAIRAGQLGLKTAIVEREKTERLGGTCLLRGCIPTKAMLQTADLLAKASHAEDFGISLSDPKVDMDKMDKYRARIVKKNAGGVKYLMKKNNVDVHFGHGRIAGKNKVSVEGLDGKTTTLETKHCVLATGSACQHLPFIEMDHERIIDSDDLLQMTDKPEHLVVIGAGAVGSEFASVFLRYGSEVTLVEMVDRLLPIEDVEVSKEIEKSFKKQGMNVMTSSKVTDVTRTDDGVKVVVETTKGGKNSAKEIQASHLLVATGRRPVTGDCGLDKTKIEVDDRGYIAVDEYMQTAEDWVYAIGDIVNTPWLAHVASHEGILAVDHLAGEPAHPLNYDLVPNCTYTSPEVASVGLTEEQAKERGYDVKTGTFPFSAIGKASIVGQTEGFVKIVSETKYDELLGMHIIGPKATELITEGTVAMELESTVVELLHTIHPHPTLAEAVGEAAHAVMGETIHI
ncbi:dihydrolipoyl dehydrogenase [Persicimonas caeni]|uniref:Dihydrolipoyl dehydrogenase n=1 Tax=Persicimonas caeni TaxID=2292766 RepID=A0A4Y6PUU2_PERCE|nr:dihydrolipoyl dehydrogenase [Persicimonas caeni]QDG51525.1 dihydrolipoyl dehydrogenase [Persicimonas caeni]QED32746.1 dihydrolipoyl dehydrogenase [Persicimonas caeni]